MPRKFANLISLPYEQPTRCNLCPLCGPIPKHLLAPGSRQTYACGAFLRTMSARRAAADMSDRNARHPLRRPCDRHWKKWRDIWKGRPVAIWFDELLLRPQREARQPLLFADALQPPESEKAKEWERAARYWAKKARQL